MEKDKQPFFSALRYGTIAGMLANPEYGGNYNKTGWTLDRLRRSVLLVGPPFGWYDRNA